jgi:two-component system, OmpR family, sensor histidine kinase CiaH
MFHSARIKLTAWYLLIIMLISISFSVAMYQMLTSELDRVERIQRSRIEHGIFGGPRFYVPSVINNDDLPLPYIDPTLITETKERLKMLLMFINIGILGTSAAAGYFLAGRTLKPIHDMVEEQNRFISDASHELRTPLTSLKSEIEVNLRDPKLSLVESKELLKSNLEEVNNLQALSDNLIKITKFGKDNNRLIFSSVSSLQIFKEAFKKINGLVKNKHITVENNLKDYSIWGNKDSLVELFVIFLDNAIKYSPENSTIKLSCKKEKEFVTFQITDQGMGISKQDLPYLFDRFYRADKSRTKSDIPGYGLGLSIAKQIIDEHHGSIKVQSKINSGTTFTIFLPVKS